MFSCEVGAGGNVLWVPPLSAGGGTLVLLAGGALLWAVLRVDGAPLTPLG